MKPIFAMTLREGAEAARCDGCVETPQTGSAAIFIGGVISLALMIGIAILFATSVKKMIRNKRNFSGTAWGVINGILGIGILPTIIAYVSINNEIAKIKDKRYAKYAKEEIKKVSLYIHYIYSHLDSD